MKKLSLTPESSAVSVINLNNNSHPDLILMAELSVLVRVSIAWITFSLNSVTVPNGSSLIYSKSVWIAATAGDTWLSFLSKSLKNVDRS